MPFDVGCCNPNEWIRLLHRGWIYSFGEDLNKRRGLVLLNLFKKLRLAARTKATAFISPPVTLSLIRQKSPAHESSNQLHFCEKLTLIHYLISCSSIDTTVISFISKLSSMCLGLNLSTAQILSPKTYLFMDMSRWSVITSTVKRQDRQKCDRARTLGQFPRSLGF